MKEAGSASFGDLVRAAVNKGEPVNGVVGNRTGGNFALPLDRLAVIESENVSGRERIIDGVDWLAGDAAESPILSRLRLVPTTQTRGRLASGQALPQTAMQPESGSAAFTRLSAYMLPAMPSVGDLVRWVASIVYAEGGAFPGTPTEGDLFRFNAAATGLTGAVDVDGSTAITVAAASDLFRRDATQWVKQPVTGGSLSVDEAYRWSGTRWAFIPHPFAEHEYELSSVIETKTEISTQLVMQSEPAMDDVVEAHRLAISDKLLEQILSGDGTGNNLAGVAGATGIGSATYMTADRGKDTAFTAGELAVEDGGGRLPYMGWALGADLSTSARTIAIEPGASRRVEERGRLTLSGTPTQRITEGLASTTGLCGDWQTVIVPILSELLVTVDTVSAPGDVRLTSRLPCADPIISHPGAIYKLSQV